MPIKAVVVLKAASGIDADNFVNTFAVRTTATYPNLAQQLLLAQHIANFYNLDPAGAPTPPHTYISAAVSRTALACRVHLYDITGKLNGAVHGSPTFSHSWTIGAETAGPLNMPAEVAFVLTLEALGRAAAAVEAPDGADADLLIDRPKQRHTGRIYLGPLTSNALVVEGGTNIARPDGTFASNMRQCIKDLEQRLRTDAAAPDVLGLGVWSRKDAVMRSLFSVSTDNAFDTQRRRGPDATARTRLEVA